MDSLDTIILIGARSTCISLSSTGFDLNILPKSAGIWCTLSINYKIKHGMNISKNKKHVRQYEKDQQTMNPLKNCTKIDSEIIYLMKLNMTISVRALLRNWMKRKLSLFSTK